MGPFTFQKSHLILFGYVGSILINSMFCYQFGIICPLGIDVVYLWRVSGGSD